MANRDLFKFLVQAANCLAAATDGFISFSIIYFLHKRRTGREQSVFSISRLHFTEPDVIDLFRTNGVLNWLMAYTVNSGAITMWVMIEF